MSAKALTDRAALATGFVLAAGWGDAQSGFLAGDASARRYERLTRNGQTAVLMDAPPERGEDTRPFLQMARHLRALGLSAPEVLAQDEDNGFLLLEDLGDDLYARLLDKAPSQEVELYEAAVDVLVHLQTAPPPPGLPDHTQAFMATAAGLSVEWYDFAVTGRRADPGGIVDVMAEALERHCQGTPVLVLRDYHAENLLWLPDRAGLGRVGLLDFQMGSMGHGCYDLISLLQDARRDVSEPLVGPMMRRYADRMGQSLDRVETACAVMGAQRALRVLGAFARLSLRFGKPGYVRLIPRVWGHLQHALDHPALEEMRHLVTKDLPPPTPEALERITRQCGSFPVL